MPEKVLAIIEEAYPNSLTIDDMSRRFKSETEVVRNMVLELVNKKLVKPVGVGVPGAAGLDSAAGIFICNSKTKSEFLSLHPHLHRGCPIIIWTDVLHQTSKTIGPRVKSQARGQNNWSRALK